jgi:REP element-mobilizing transposase RayT
MNKEKKYYKDTYHHRYNRGANKANIFFEKEYYLHFLRKMKHYCNKYNIKILAYCLMTNHFHLFIKQTSDCPASKSKLIEDEAYFIWVIKYILENPVEAKMVKILVIGSFLMQEIY